MALVARLTVPPQGLLRAVLLQGGGLRHFYRDVQYQAAFNRCVRASGHDWTCADCGWTVSADDVDAVAAGLVIAGGASSLGRSGDESGGGSDPGHGIFQARPSGLASGSYDYDKLDLVCRPCFLASHAFLPVGPACGHLGLLNGMEQHEVIHFWRGCAMVASSDDVNAGAALLHLSELHGYALNTLQAAAAIKSEERGMFNGGSDRFAYWLAHTSEQTYQDFSDCMAADLRFVPSEGDLEYFIDFVRRLSAGGSGRPARLQ